MPKTMGPVMLDLTGTELTQEEHDILQHPLVGGVILFARNYVSPEQIAALCQAIRVAAKKNIWIGVDHEGGRVQRFREGFTIIPSMGKIGELFDCSPLEGLKLAEICGWIMAAELKAVGIDFSFAPVLDLNKKLNTVIGDRAFHNDPEKVVLLAKALFRGMQAVVMPAIGKHFPGHGHVTIDSHMGKPKDERPLNQIMAEDIIPFISLIQAGMQGMMPAHIIFPEVDVHPVGFSAIWLKNILRKQLQFKGIIFSDDLNMDGASHYEDYTERAKQALTAGCDMALICNNRKGAIQILDHLPQDYFITEEKMTNIPFSFSNAIDDLTKTHDWQTRTAQLKQLIQRNEYDTPQYP